MKRWFLEKRITLPLLITLAVQFVSIVMWATYLDARVTALESAHGDAKGVSVQLGRLEERVEAVRGELVIIRQHLDRLSERK